MSVEAQDGFRPAFVGENALGPAFTCSDAWFLTVISSHVSSAEARLPIFRVEKS